MPKNQIINCTLGSRLTAWNIPLTQHEIQLFVNDALSLVLLDCLIESFPPQVASCMQIISWPRFTAAENETKLPWARVLLQSRADKSVRLRFLLRFLRHGPIDSHVIRKHLQVNELLSPKVVSHLFSVWEKSFDQKLNDGFQTVNCSTESVQLTHSFVEAIVSAISKLKECKMSNVINCIRWVGAAACRW